jgi:hypothetical protein
MRSRPLASGRGAEEPISQLFFPMPIPRRRALLVRCRPLTGRISIRGSGEFLLPYEVGTEINRAGNNAHGISCEHLCAAADLGGWDRKALDLG